MIEVEVLLVERGEVGADGAEGGGAGESTKAAGDFLLDLAHPDCLLGDVIGEGCIGIESESEHIVFVLAQSRQEIRCVALSSAAALAGRWNRWIE